MTLMNSRTFFCATNFCPLLLLVSYITTPILFFSILTSLAVQMNHFTTNVLGGGSIKP
jgi:hypothetical protein